MDLGVLEVLCGARTVPGVGGERVTCSTRGRMDVCSGAVLNEALMIGQRGGERSALVAGPEHGVSAGFMGKAMLQKSVLYLHLGPDLGPAQGQGGHWSPEICWIKGQPVQYPTASITYPFFELEEA